MTLPIQSRVFGPARHVLAAALLILAGCGDRGSESASRAANTPAEPDTLPVESTQTHAESVPVQSAAPVIASPGMLDFGFIRPNETATGTVELRNTGDEAVKIASSKATCKCTSVDLAGVVIEPGESVPMEITMDGGSSPATRSAAVNVLFEGYTDQLQVGVQLEVAYGVKANKNHINLVRKDPETGRPMNLTGEINVSSIDNKPFRVLSANEQPPEFVRFDPESDEPRSSYTLKYDLSDIASTDLPRFWIIETTHPDGATIDIRVRHLDNLQFSDLFFTGRRANLGRIDPNQPLEHTVTIRWRRSRPERITSVSADSDLLDAKLLDQRMGGEDGDETFCTIKITPNPDHRGFFRVPITFKTATKQADLPCFGRMVAADEDEA